MARIDGLSRILEIIRLQAAKGSERPVKPGKSGGNTTHRSPAQSKPSLAQLEKRLADRLRQIDTKDDDWEPRAVSIFVGAILTWEFGEELVDDARFNELVKKVQDALVNHPPTEQKLLQTLHALSAPTL